MAVEFYKEFGELGYLANYSNHGFYKDGVFYKTVEHYYQAMKYDNKEIRNKIINALTPKEASNIGRDRNNIRIDNFKTIKDNVMYEGILEKFRQHRDIRNKLIATGNDEIKEMTINEFYWGVGHDLSGENHVGKILMKVRETIKEEVINLFINKSLDKKIYITMPNYDDNDSKLASRLLCDIFTSYGIDVEVGDKDLDIKDKYLFLINYDNLDNIDTDKVIGSISIYNLNDSCIDNISINYKSCTSLIYDLFKDRYIFDNDSAKEKLLIL